MERLDIYDENMNHIGSEDREIVHQKGLWHKTIHCWLYDKEGNIYFQIRANSKKLYTTASGHVLEGETISEAFNREVREEIGVNLELLNAELVELTVWKMDKIKNGIPFIDRVFANVFINQIDSNYNEFNFDPNEVLGVVRVNAKECLDLFCGKLSRINAQKITQENRQDITIGVEDFVVQPGEIAVIKYGKILQSVIRAVSQTS